MLHTTLVAMLAFVTAEPLQTQPPGFAPRFGAYSCYTYNQTCLLYLLCLLYLQHVLCLLNWLYLPHLLHVHSTCHGKTVPTTCYTLPGASIELMLYASSHFSGAVFSTISRELTKQSEVAIPLLERAASRLLPQLGIDLDLDNDAQPAAGTAEVLLTTAEEEPDGAEAAAAAAEVAAAEAATAAAAGGGLRSQGKPYETGVILGLAYLLLH
jgi:hypothetical protein